MHTSTGFAMAEFGGENGAVSRGKSTRMNLLERLCSKVRNKNIGAMRWRTASLAKIRQCADLLARW